ncbi:head-tail connector protein [Sphingobium bisphenolivorans]|uniref:head-tail connector protein n=1 Tax=Sphingobium bisphenolivorans TaxID=1335760 RepID=UPI0003A4BCA9|nr:phage head-tail connector protein [Sphingobium bisphenolivorans]
MLVELKAWLRIGSDDEDGVLERLLASATGLCEQFIGQWLIVREASETAGADGTWQRLSGRPVVAILGVEAQGSALAADAYAIDIDAAGDGWVRVRPDVGMATVRYHAGMAQDAEGLPDAIRQGIVRLAAEHFGARDGQVATPPAVVSALWRPWRRMRLT